MGCWNYGNRELDKEEESRAGGEGESLSSFSTVLPSYGRAVQVHMLRNPVENRRNPFAIPGEDTDGLGSVDEGRKTKGFRRQTRISLSQIIGRIKKLLLHLETRFGLTLLCQSVL